MRDWPQGSQEAGVGLAINRGLSQGGGKSFDEPGQPPGSQPLHQQPMTLFLQGDVLLAMGERKKKTKFVLAAQKNAKENTGNTHAHCGKRIRGANIQEAKLSSECCRCKFVGKYTTQTGMFPKLDLPGVDPAVIQLESPVDKLEATIQADRPLFNAHSFWTLRRLGSSNVRTIVNLDAFCARLLVFAKARDSPKHRSKETTGDGCLHACQKLSVVSLEEGGQSNR